MRFTLKLMESDSTIRKNVLDILSKQISNIFKKSVVPIESKIKILIKNSLMNQPEYFSLVSSNGELRLNFGIENTSMINNVISDMVSATTFTIQPVKVSNVGLSGGFTLKFLSESAISSISSSYSVITDKGQSLPWLSWLLYEGTAPIVRNYEIRFGNNPYSKTGGAIMIPSDKNWRVPATFAGTIRNNWITRAIINIDNDIYSIIENTIKDNI